MILRIGLAVTCSILAFVGGRILGDHKKKKNSHAKKPRRDPAKSRSAVYAEPISSEDEVVEKTVINEELATSHLLLPEFDDILQGGEFGLEFSDCGDDFEDEEDYEESENEDAEELSEEGDTENEESDPEIESNADLGEQVENPDLTPDDPDDGDVGSSPPSDSQKHGNTAREIEDEEAIKQLIKANYDGFERKSDEIHDANSKIHALSEPQLVPNAKQAENDPISEEILELWSLRNIVQELKEKEKQYEVDIKNLNLELERLNAIEGAYNSQCNDVEKQKSEIEKLKLQVTDLSASIKKNSKNYDKELKKVKDELSQALLRENELQKRIKGINSSPVEVHLLKQITNRLKSREEEMSSLEKMTKEREKEMEKIQKSLKEADSELLELRRTSKEIQMEKRMLTEELEETRKKLEELQMPESQALKKTQAENILLRQRVCDLLRQVEGLQNSRFSEVEEMVYLRWVNACLRYELRNSKLPPGQMSALDLNKDRSPKSLEKAKQLMMEFAYPKGIDGTNAQTDREDTESIFSEESTFTEGDEDSSSHEAGSSKSSSMRKGSKLLRKLGLSRKSKSINSESQIQKDEIHRSKSLSSQNRVVTLSDEIKLRRDLSTDMADDNLPDLPLIKTEKSDADSLSEPSLANSFKLISKTSLGALDLKYPAFRDRHRMYQAKTTEVKKSTDENMAGKRAGKLKSKSTVVEVQKRQTRVATAPPPPTPLNTVTNTTSDSVQKNNLAPGSVPPPPPPPGKKGGPPLPPPLPPKGKLTVQDKNGMQRVHGVVELYQSLMKRDAKNAVVLGSGEGDGASGDSRNNLIGEIENRASHLLAIKQDVEDQADFVKSLATTVRSAIYVNIDDVVAFVNWLDEELSFLVDENGVLKHFDWPEGKTDALREAAFEYLDLVKLETEVSGFVDDTKIPADITFQKMLSILEKAEQSVFAVLRTRDMAISRYNEFKIPTYWIQDTGIISQIKQGSVKLARQYMKRVTNELDKLQNAGPDKEPLKEFLILQGVRFAFRVHQFAGGFDSESMKEFEQLRLRVTSLN